MAQDDGLLIVTGGARGIGAATVRLAARRGRPVAFSYAGREDAAQALVAEVEAAGGRVLALRSDVSDPQAVERFFDAAAERFGPPAAVFANAGITGESRRLLDLAPETLSRVLAVNVEGAFHTARAALRRMSTALGGMGGAIVFASSRAAKIGGGGEWLHYAASKGAIDTLTVGLAREVGAEGVRVNAVAPGLVLTDIHAPAGGEARVERLLPGVPLGRAGLPEEVAEAVLWLASAAASYVNGAVLDIGGGR